MIRTEALEEIISLCIASAYLNGDNSVSLLILAKPESGKTQTLREFSVNDGVCWLSDITYTGLINLLDKVKEGLVKTILIPDMLKLFGKNVSVRSNFLTLLNELIEEGIKSIMTYDKTIDYPFFIRCNVISAITSTDFFQSRRLMGGIGFLSRVVPFSYKYSVDDVNEIFKLIMNGSNALEFKKLKLPKKKVKISIPMDLCERIKNNITLRVVERFKRRVGEEAYGFRLQRNLQTLAKASALLNKRSEVIDKDVEKLEWLSEWINYDFNVLKDKNAQKDDDGD
jgi:hypothetical protein